MTLVGPSSYERHEDYQKYKKLVGDRIANRKMAALTLDSHDFENQRSRSVAMVTEAISQLLLVDGVRYKKTAGIAIAVNDDYNGYIRVSEMEMWDASMWRQKPHNPLRSKEDMHTHYFAYSDRHEANAFAQELGAKLGRRVHIEDDNVVAFVPAETLPQPDMRWAELVRSATAAAHFTGMEIARRIRNQEVSIFTDDRSLRHAFDRMMAALDDADPFGEPDERVEVAARGLLDLIRRNGNASDTRYRNLATRWAEAFDHLDIALARWDDRPMEIEVTYSQPEIAR
ncbi:hypothetical protein GOB57_09630 [Sinorhizobium meliloti]|nr:hypothetical protein [Sinorhizobium meliloti]